MAEGNRTDEIQGQIVHVYDGIEEADNRLPLWWLWTFYLAMAFAVGYWFYYHEYDVGQLPMAEYETALAAMPDDGGDVDEDVLIALGEDGTAVEAGQAIFGTHCAVCHGDDAQGNIGPNLTDPNWIHGGSASDIHHSIRVGVPTQGMPAWGRTLGGESVQQLTAYVLSVRDTNVDGKEAQGEVWAP